MWFVISVFDQPTLLYQNEFDCDLLAYVNSSKIEYCDIIETF